MQCTTALGFSSPIEKHTCFKENNAREWAMFDLLSIHCDVGPRQRAAVPYGLVVRIPAFHAGGPGSIPGVGGAFAPGKLNLSHSD